MATLVADARYLRTVHGWRGKHFQKPIGAPMSFQNGINKLRTYYAHGKPYKSKINITEARGKKKPKSSRNNSQQPSDQQTGQALGQGQGESGYRPSNKPGWWNTANKHWRWYKDQEGPMVRLLEALFSKDPDTDVFLVAFDFEGWNGKPKYYPIPSEMGMYGVALDGSKICCRDYHVIDSQNPTRMSTRHPFSFCYDEPQDCRYVVASQLPELWASFIKHLTGEGDGRKKEVILVCWDKTLDTWFLDNVGIALAPEERQFVDAQVLYSMFLYPTAAARRNLGHMARKNELIESDQAHFHSSGNDAYYTLRLFVEALRHADRAGPDPILGEGWAVGADSTLWAGMKDEEKEGFVYGKVRNASRQMNPATSQTGYYEYVGWPDWWDHQPGRDQTRNQPGAPHYWDEEPGWDVHKTFLIAPREIIMAGRADNWKRDREAGIKRRNDAWLAVSGDPDAHPSFATKTNIFVSYGAPLQNHPLTRQPTPA